MALKKRFKDSEIILQLKKEVEKIENDFIEILHYVGEQFVTDARNQVTFKDHTGNLRSSIGYLILQNGVPIHQDLKGNSEGISEAVRALQNVPQLPGIQLIVVAGMEYASYVESMGLNVITAQGDLAIINLHRIVKKYANSKELKI